MSPAPEPNKKFPDFIPPTKVHYDGQKPTIHLRKCKLTTQLGGRTREHIFEKSSVAIGAMEASASRNVHGLAGIGARQLINMFCAPLCFCQPGAGVLAKNPFQNLPGNRPRLLNLGRSAMSHY